MKLKDLVEAIIYAYELGYEKSIEDAEIFEEVKLENDLDNISFKFDKDGE